jgi:hypothetical protein
LASTWLGGLFFGFQPNECQNLYACFNFGIKPNRLVLPAESIPKFQTGPNCQLFIMICLRRACQIQLIHLRNQQEDIKKEN